MLILHVPSLQLNIIVICQRNRKTAVLSETNHSLSKAVVAHIVYNNNLSNGYTYRHVFSFSLVELIKCSRSSLLPQRKTLWYFLGNIVHYFNTQIDFSFFLEKEGKSCAVLFSPSEENARVSKH